MTRCVVGTQWLMTALNEKSEGCKGGNPLTTDAQGRRVSWGIQSLRPAFPSATPHLRASVFHPDEIGGG